MSAGEGRPGPLPSVDPRPPNPRADALPALCPYLATLDGNSRRASANRDHRCVAVSPPVQLAPEKQRRLCLVADHVNCATYGAALNAHDSLPDRVPGHARPIARIRPIVLDEGRFAGQLPALRADRAAGQAVLVGLLVIAFAAILVARPSADAVPAGALGADASASPRASAGAPGDAVATPSTAPPTAAAPTAAAPTAATAPAETPDATERPPPASTRAPLTGATYRVRSGDTLIAIATRFGTTGQVLVKLNGLADPSKLKIGQVLLLP